MGGAVQVTFYDVPADQRWALVAKMAEAAWRKDKRLVVHCADADEAGALDEFLWTYRDEAFLPHELVAPGAVPDDADARVVIVTQEARPIEAPVLVQVTPTSLAFAQRFENVIDVVDRRDDGRLAESRDRFRAWREAGVDPRYQKY